MTLSHRLELLLGLSLTLSFFSFGKKVLYPIQLFTTWLHECCHAITALILGGHSIHITISSDGSGLTHFSIPKGKLRHGIIASSGYVGASLCGCLIFALSMGTEKLPKYFNIQALVFCLCILIILSLTFWIRNFFGFVSVLLLGAALASLNYPPMKQYSQEVLLFIGIQTALNAAFDIRTLFSVKISKGNVSDAHTMQKLFHLPHSFWAMLWLSLSFMMIYFTAKLTL